MQKDMSIDKHDKDVFVPITNTQTNTHACCKIRIEFDVITGFGNEILALYVDWILMGKIKEGEGG